MVRRAVVTAALALAVAGCGEDGSKPSATIGSSSPSSTTSVPTPSTPASPPPSPAPSRSGRTGTRVITADSDHGPMLYDRSGQPIYLFDKEGTSRPECYGGCAKAWPPVLTRGAPRGLDGARQGLLGTTERRDGTLQVTYAGHPLYFYAHEGKYQVLCHDVVEYGGRWLVVQPDGDPAP
jgi:predicted lipoprotein with Yx(FWY)xxD motif